MLKTPKITSKLLGLNLKLFLEENQYNNSHTFLLKNTEYSKEEKWWLAEQIKLYNKGNKKIDTFKQFYCWFTSKSFEQCSSEATAKYKSTLFSGNNFLDLSGGFGVDDWAFSKTFKQVISIDNDENLNEIVRANFNKLNIPNIERINETAINYLNNNQKKFDLIYIDADRRSGKEKSVLFTDGNPNVLEILDKCTQFSDKILIKLSPLIDLTYCKKWLKNLSQIILVEFEQELKEVLCLVEPNKPEPILKIAWLNNHNITEMVFKQNNDLLKTFTKPLAGNIMFEPSAAMRKANVGLAYAKQFKLNLINSSATYLVGEKINLNFIGRQFEIIDVFEFSQKAVQQYLGSKNIKQANIAAKEFVLKPEDIYKKFKLKTGGNSYLFFTTLPNGNKIVINCVKPTIIP